MNVLLNKSYAKSRLDTSLNAILKRQPNSRKIIVWGTGSISEMLSSYVSQFVPILFHISKEAISQRIFLGRLVYLKEEVSLVADKYYVIILAHPQYGEIRDDLHTMGFTED